MNTFVEPDSRFHIYKGKAYPRATYVLEVAYAKDKYFYEWLMKNGEDATRIKDDAALKGTHIHRAVERLLLGEELIADDYHIEEWKKIVVFSSWYQEVKPKIISLETPVFHKGLGVVGTFDAHVEIDGKNLIVDWKSGKTWQDSYFVQTSFYACAYESMTKIKLDGTAVLRLGTTHKKGWEWKERNREEMLADFDIYKSCKKIFDFKMGDCKPSDKEYPCTLKLV